MEEQVMKDQDIYPEDEIIKSHLSEEDFDRYLKFMEKIEMLNLLIEWRFYNDGKVWLGKILNKKKNMGWLSIWNTGFKITVFLTKRIIPGFNELDIDSEIKSSIVDIKPTGRLIPVIRLIDNDSILNDMLSIIEYKITIK